MISNEELENFRHEIIEEVEKIDSLLYDLANADLGEIKKSYLRFLHNLKGTSGMFELKALESYCHHVENGLESIEFNIELEDTLLKITQTIESYANNMNEALLDLKNINISATPSKLEQPKIESKDERSQEYVEVMKFSLNDLIESKNQEESVIEKEAPLVSPNIKTKLKYALIEDEQFLGSSIKKQLARYGVEVDHFENGNDFFNSKALKNYHLVITDKNLPGISGIEVIKKFKQEVDSMIPIIVISGYLDESALLEASQLGVSSILPKPFKPKHLVRQGFNSSLHYLNRILLEKALKAINYSFGAIKFGSKLTDEEIDSLKQEIKEINIEMIKIKKYFASIHKSDL